MATIKNPNDIVDEFVSDYQKACGNTLVSVIMYGSAVTHEYRPGRSDINMAIVLTDNSISQINKLFDTHKKWRRRKLSAPFFMTPDYIKRSLDTYPIEFLDMQKNYRVLYGEDVLATLEIKREHLRLQCERELKGAALHLRTGYIHSGGNARAMHSLLLLSMRQLLPVFKALLVLGEKTIPSTKADIISAVEERYQISDMILSEIFQLASQKPKRNYQEIFDGYTRIVDTLIDTVDTMENEGS